MSLLSQNTLQKFPFPYNEVFDDLKIGDSRID